ncbi:hypothetical protein CTEN210_06530 [Chaetoceros tenuissimus]|uniref:Leucine-rich repeat domain-containing protein n=1 Tax=Chaetoceros tenuissimus TaxID=426638 RepID=A0AAD3CSU8_9STRA|nr:hypothetical protein CTEN210_06530 [Chaetoceros tenuissimus]
MRVQTEEWRRFIPGSRMYKDKKTFFYNGEILLDGENDEFLIYDWEERQTWEVVIVLPGVEVIPPDTFQFCRNVKTVIMADSVRRIERSAFGYCKILEFVKLSRTVEFIGDSAFWYCESLSSIFIPPLCSQIDRDAFRGCKELIILSVPRQTQLGECVIGRTKLLRASPYGIPLHDGLYDNITNSNVNFWIKNIHGNDDRFALHRACSSFNPIAQVIYEIVKRQGLMSFQRKNRIGITPTQYLEVNPFAEDIDQCSVVKRYVLEMMGEAV